MMLKMGSDWLFDRKMKLMSKFKVLELNWCKKKFQDEIDINFKMLRLKMIFTQKFK